MLSRCRLSMILFLTVLPCIASDVPKWGDPVDGLRMSVSVAAADSSIGRQLRVTVQNIGERDLLVPLGAIIGYKAYPDKLKVVLTTPDGKHPRVIYTAIAGVAGRLDSLVIPLLSGASYTVRNPIEKYYVLDESEKLDNFLSRRCQLHVELDLQKSVCPLYGFPNPNMLTCWEGKLRSNAVDLPSETSVYHSDHTRWISESLRSMQTIKVGMTRKELLTVFMTEGGLSTRQRRRYVYRDCPYIKIDVDFAPAKGNERDESLEDKIVNVSKPFVEWAIMD